MKINNRVIILREAIVKIVQILASKKVRVTQQGTRAFCEYRNSVLYRVNIPYIPDDASDDLLDAVQGFVDHELGHVLFTDPGILEEARKLGVAQMHNVMEDVFVERKMAEQFTGSLSNINAVVKFYILKHSEAKVKEGKYLDGLLVPAFRAWGGQRVAQDYMADKWHLIEPLVKKLGSVMPDILKNMKNSRDALEAALTVKKILVTPMPTCELPGGEPEFGEGDGEGESIPFEKPSEDTKITESEAHKGEKGKPDEKSEEAKPTEKESKGKGKKKKEPKPEEAKPEEKGAGKPTEKEEKKEAEGAGKEDEKEKPGADEKEESAGGKKEESEKPEPEAKSEEGSPDADSEAEGDDTPAGGDEESKEADEDDDGDAPGEGDPEGDAGEAEGPDEDTDADEAGAPPSSEGKTGGIGEEEEPTPPIPPEELERAAAESEFDETVAEEISKRAGEVAEESDYVIFTRDYDRIEPFDGPCDDAWLKQIQDTVDHMVGPLQKELERAVAARSAVVWTGGHKSGRLHSGSLHRLQFDRSDVFRRKQPNESKSVAAEVVIDISGSMDDGVKLPLAAQAGYALASVLDRMNISNEVICFTTTGFPRSVYDELGREPARLKYARTEALYMPILKGFDERMTTEVKRRFAAFDKTVRCAQNVDGECVQIAARRLALRREKRKIMFVLSDGHPVCPGDPRQLRAHLKAVVKEIDKAGIDVMGIGIRDHAVQEFYSRHVVLNDIAELPGECIRQLKDMLFKAKLARVA